MLVMESLRVHCPSLIVLTQRMVQRVDITDHPKLQTRPMRAKREIHVVEVETVEGGFVKTDLQCRVSPSRNEQSIQRLNLFEHPAGCRVNIHFEPAGSMRMPNLSVNKRRARRKPHRVQNKARARNSDYVEMPEMLADSLRKIRRKNLNVIVNKNQVLAPGGTNAAIVALGK